MEDILRKLHSVDATSAQPIEDKGLESHSIDYVRAFNKGFFDNVNLSPEEVYEKYNLSKHGLSSPNDSGNTTHYHFVDYLKNSIAARVVKVIGEGLTHNGLIEEEY